MVGGVRQCRVWLAEPSARRALQDGNVALIGIGQTPVPQSSDQDVQARRAAGWPVPLKLSQLGPSAVGLDPAAGQGWMGSALQQGG